MGGQAGLWSRGPLTVLILVQIVNLFAQKILKSFVLEVSKRDKLEKKAKGEGGDYGGQDDDPHGRKPNPEKVSEKPKEEESVSEKLKTN